MPAQELQPIISPPPSPQVPGGVPPSSPQQPTQPAGKVETSPSPKKGFPKIVLVLLVLLLLLGLGFAVWKFVLPMLGVGKEKSLTWWGLWEEESVVASLITEYEQENPDVKITYVKQSHQDYRERLTNALAQGTGPDIFRFHNTWVPMFKNELDNVPASVMTAAEYAESFYPIISSDLTSGAGLVGIPLGYDGLALYINEDIFTAAEKQPPTTWDDLRQTAIELTVKDENGAIIQAGVAIGRTENVDHWPEILALMMLQNGASPANPTDRRAQDALTYFTIFSSVDGVWDETLPASTIAFAGGKLAMYFGPTWRTFEIVQQSSSLNFKTVPLPQLPKDSPSQPDIAYASYWADGVWARSTNKEAAWDFLEFISSEASLEKMYQNAAQNRPSEGPIFGEPYPRVDMAELLLDHPIVGSVIEQASDARSWYLVSRTHDGPTGINSQIVKYYEDAVNSVNSGVRADKALETVVSGVSQILSQYGLISQ